MKNYKVIYFAMFIASCLSSNIDAEISYNDTNVTYEYSNVPGGLRGIVIKKDNDSRSAFKANILFNDGERADNLLSIIFTPDEITYTYGDDNLHAFDGSEAIYPYNRQITYNKDGQIIQKRYADDYVEIQG